MEALSAEPVVYDRAVWTKFQRVTDVPDTACVKLVMCNISNRPIVYKFKSKRTVLITAEPSAFGKIPPHGISSCLLIWRRPPDVTNWKELKSTSLAMITEFEGSEDPYVNEHTVTKVKCRISSSAVCESKKPPEEHITFKSALDSILLPSPSSRSGKSPETGRITPIIVPQKPCGSPNTTSKRIMTVGRYRNALDHSPVSPIRQVHVLYLESKGAVVIVLFVVILALCTRLLVETKQTN